MLITPADHTCRGASRLYDELKHRRVTGQIRRGEVVHGRTGIDHPRRHRTTHRGLDDELRRDGLEIPR